MSVAVLASASDPQASMDAVLPAPASPVVFFDGVCGFCNASVNFCLKHDTRQRLLFAPLQGVTAEQLLPGSLRERLDSLVFWTPERAFVRSAAVVRVLWTLGDGWMILGGLLWLIPLPVRDLGYRIVARWRYRLFGRSEACRLPSAAERERFLL